jgi:hypothetical protein
MIITIQSTFHPPYSMGIFILDPFPDCLLTKILDVWLTIHDIGRFDIALCARDIRERYLCCLSKFTVVLKAVHLYEKNQSILPWLIDRNLSVKNLIVYDTISVNLVMKLSDTFCSTLSELVLETNSRIQTETLCTMLNRFANLTSLVIKFNYNHITDAEFLPMIQKVPKLRRLMVAYAHKLTNALFFHLPAYVPHLESLTCYYCQLLNVSVAYLCLHSLPKLHTFYMNNCYNTTPLVIFPALRTSEEDTEMNRIQLQLPPLPLNTPPNVHDPTLSTVSMQVPKMLVCSPNISIRVFDISYCWYIEHDILSLLLSLLPNIEILRLKGYLLSTEQMIIIASKCKKVHFLDLSACYTVTDEQMNILTRSLGHQLKTLLLHFCRGITAETIKSIGKYCTILERLECWYCHLIEGDDAMKYLIEHDLEETEEDEEEVENEASALNANTNVPSQPIARVTKLMNSHLIELSLDHIHSLSNQSLILLFQEKGNYFPYLQKLSIVECFGITDAVFRSLLSTATRPILDPAVSPLSSKETVLLPPLLHRLKVINVEGCQLLTDESILIIANEAWALEVLNISRCFNITTKSILHLLSTSHDCRADDMSSCKARPLRTLLCKRVPGMQIFALFIQLNTLHTRTLFPHLTCLDIRDCDTKYELSSALLTGNALPVSPSKTRRQLFHVEDSTATTIFANAAAGCEFFIRLIHAYPCLERIYMDINTITKYLYTAGTASEKLRECLTLHRVILNPMSKS